MSKSLKSMMLYYIICILIQVIFSCIQRFWVFENIEKGSAKQVCFQGGGLIHWKAIKKDHGILRITLGLRCDGLSLE